MLGHLLLKLLIVVLACAAFYGLYRFAKSRGAFDDGPPATGNGGGIIGGTPPKPK